MMKVFASRYLWLIALAAALWVTGLWEVWQLNELSLHLLSGREPTSGILTTDCSHMWMLGLTAGRRGDLAAQRDAFVRALDCSPESVSMLQAVIPDDLELARAATRKYPEVAKAWFWLGEAIASSDPQESRQAYRQTVAVNPIYGLAWCRLGGNYRTTEELEKAAGAYLNCCLNGDPGSNGCYQAGRAMEQLGNMHKAIEYYRLSRWDRAIELADELEAQLAPDQ